MTIVDPRMLVVELALGGLHRVADRHPRVFVGVIGVGVLGRDDLASAHLEAHVHVERRVLLVRGLHRDVRAVEGPVAAELVEPLVHASPDGLGGLHAAEGELPIVHKFQPTHGSGIWARNRCGLPREPASVQRALASARDGLRRADPIERRGHDPARKPGSLADREQTRQRRRLQHLSITVDSDR